MIYNNYKHQKDATTARQRTMNPVALWSQKDKTHPLTTSDD